MLVLKRGTNDLNNVKSSDDLMYKIKDDIDLLIKIVFWHDEKMHMNDQTDD